MFLAWTRHITDPTEKENFERSISHAKHVLDRVKDLVQEEEKSLDQTEMDSKAYENPAWAYKQAFKNGYRTGLNFTKKLVDLDQQKSKKE